MDNLFADLMSFLGFSMIAVGLIRYARDILILKGLRSSTAGPPVSGATKTFLLLTACSVKHDNALPRHSSTVRHPLSDL